jgi:hypothetical protein
MHRTQESQRVTVVRRQPARKYETAQARPLARATVVRGDPHGPTSPGVEHWSIESTGCCLRNWEAAHTLLRASEGTGQTGMPTLEQVIGSRQRIPCATFAAALRHWLNRSELHRLAAQQRSRIAVPAHFCRHALQPHPSAHEAPW